MQPRAASFLYTWVCGLCMHRQAAVLVAHAAHSYEVLATRWYVRTIVYGIYVYRPSWPCSSLKGIAWPNPIAQTQSRSVARVNLGRPRGVPLFRYIPEAGTLRHSTRAQTCGIPLRDSGGVRSAPGPHYRTRWVEYRTLLTRTVRARWSYSILAGWRRRHPAAFFLLFIFSFV